VKEFILLDVMQRGTKVNSDAYISMLKTKRRSLSSAFGLKSIWAKRYFSLIIQGKATPWSRSRETITQLGLTVIPHPPYSSELVPSDFLLLGPLKDAVLRRKFESYDDVVIAV
jgi:hypothetical protein